jgi:enoyl-CoA hydratase
MGEFVRVEAGDAAPAGVATIRLDRAPMNALNTQVQEELREAAAQVSTDRDIRSVVLFGGERVFAAGADVKEFAGQDHEAMMRDAARPSRSRSSRP